jgi:general secretion pathway protein I
MKRQRGFTLLEVTVALSIAAIMAVMVNQVLRQRIASHQAVLDQRMGSLCARELEVSFAVENFWPAEQQVEGALRQGEPTCYWRLDLRNTGVARTRRGELALFAESGQRQPIGHYTVFLVRQ